MSLLEIQREEAGFGLLSQLHVIMEGAGQGEGEGERERDINRDLLRYINAAQLQLIPLSTPALLVGLQFSSF